MHNTHNTAKQFSNQGRILWCTGGNSWEGEKKFRDRGAAVYLTTPINGKLGLKTGKSQQRDVCI